MGILLIWHDVTERRIREAERQTRNHAKQLEMIIEAIADAVFFAAQWTHLVRVQRRTGYNLIQGFAPHFLI
jgi:hypothetical protein